MKNTIPNILIFCVLAFFAMCHLQSCDTNPCDEIYCVPDNGSCFDGNCVCLGNWGGDSCQIDLCDSLTIVCINGGDCNRGVCDCITGYIGDSCEVLLRGIYIGNYMVSDTCLSDTLGVTYDYMTSIVGVVDSFSLIEIPNMHNTFDHIFPGVFTGADTKVTARVTEQGLIIEEQSFPAAVLLSTYKVSGFSTVHDSTSFTMNYVIEAPTNTTDTCVAVYTLQ